MKHASALLIVLAGCSASFSVGKRPQSPDEEADAEDRRIAAERVIAEQGRAAEQRHTAADASRVEWCRSHPCDSVVVKPSRQEARPRVYEDGSEGSPERNAAAGSATNVEQAANEDKARACLSVSESCFARCDAIPKPKWGTAPDNGVGEGDRVLCGQQCDDQNVRCCRRAGKQSVGQWEAGCAE
jgi:hypothetical protein